MLAFSCAEQSERERLIGVYVRPVAEELRSLELELLVRHISSGRIGNLISVVEASSELYFKEGTLRCSEVGEADLKWRALPQLRLVLTFVSEGVIAAFTLQLGAFSAGIELQYLSFPPELTVTNETQLLRHALEKAARKMPMPERRNRDKSFVSRGRSARPTQV
ncbi:MAG: hypothetical protein K2Q28_13295 [Hyphomicrobium sp.]|nr:hypothetical protein [Hyphomicrobium sp.]